MYVGGGAGISVSSNDCRGCGKANKTRVCVAVQGNTSGVEQRLNTGEWARGAPAAAPRPPPQL